MVAQQQPYRTMTSVHFKIDTSGFMVHIRAADELIHYVRQLPSVLASAVCDTKGHRLHLRAKCLVLFPAIVSYRAWTSVILQFERCHMQSSLLFCQSCNL